MHNKIPWVAEFIEKPTEIALCLQPFEKKTSTEPGRSQQAGSSTTEKPQARRPFSRYTPVTLLWSLGQWIEPSQWNAEHGWVGTGRDGPSNTTLQVKTSTLNLTWKMMASQCKFHKGESHVLTYWLPSAFWMSWCFHGISTGIPTELQ